MLVELHATHAHRARHAQLLLGALGERVGRLGRHGHLDLPHVALVRLGGELRDRRDDVPARVGLVEEVAKL